MYIASDDTMGKLGQNNDDIRIKPIMMMMHKMNCLHDATEKHSLLQCC